MRKPLLLLTCGILIAALTSAGCLWGGDDEEPDAQAAEQAVAEQSGQEQPTEEQPAEAQAAGEQPQQAEPAAAAQDQSQAQSQADAQAAPAAQDPATDEPTAEEQAQTPVRQPAREPDQQPSADEQAAAETPTQEEAPAQEEAPPQEETPTQQPAADADDTDAATETEAEPAPEPEPDLPPNHLVYGGEIRSSVITPDEPAQFRFEGAEGDLVRVRVDGLGDMDPVATLLEPNRAEIASNDDESIANRDSLIIATLPSSGLQVIRVAPYGTAYAGEFIVSVELLEAEDVDESRIVAIGENVQGRLHSANDFDTFEFTGEAGQVVRIRADGEIGADTFLELFGPDGTFLALDDDSGHALDAELTVTLPESGQYRVDVRPAIVGRPGGERHRIGDYVLSIVSPPPAPVAASGDTATQLSALALTYLDAIQTGDAITIFALAGPEQIGQTGWKSADDVPRDLSRLQDTVTAGALGEATAVVEGERARVTVALTIPGVEAAQSLQVDATNVNGQWLVDFVLRPIPVAEDDAA